MITKLLTIQQLRKARTTWAIGLSIFLLTATVPTLSHAIEEPTYQVVRDIAGVEIRQYAAYTVAEVVVPGPSSEAGNQAFPILAGYIFGKNKGERKFAMTAPVTQTPEPVKMAMTAPVAQSTTQGGYLVQFVLPKGVSQTNAPEPLDRRVQVRDVLPKQVAVIRFSGVWSESNYQEHLEKLQTALRTANFMWEGEPVYSRYNAPLTPWFLRRNEIWLNLPTQP